MDNIILSRRWVQGTPVTIDNLTGTAFTGEAQAHTFRISGVDAAGADVQITGTVTGAFLAPNNTTIPLTGTLTDGVAEVTMTSQCYELPGRFILSVYAANGDTNLCIYCGVGYVFCTETDQVAYPSAAIPDISQLIQEAQDVIDSIPEDYSALSAHFPATGKFVVGTNTSATEENAVAEGEDSVASGLSSHAEGYASEASGDYSHSEGGSIASGGYSHAEGSASEASGENAHAEGLETTASGDNSHSEGWGTTASGMNAHAEGVDTVASGNMSHSEGEGTIANHAAQSVSGTYNVADPSQAAATAKGTYAEIVGNGASASARSNARTLDWSGNEALSGDLTINKNGANEMTVGQELSDLKSALQPITGNGIIEMVRNAQITNSGATLDLNGITSRAGRNCAIIECSVGNIFTINGTSGTTLRLYAFYDANDPPHLIDGTMAPANATGNNTQIIAPANAKYLAINDLSGQAVSYYGKLLSKTITEMQTQITANTTNITQNTGNIAEITTDLTDITREIGLTNITGWQSGAILGGTSANIASAVASPAQSTVFEYVIVGCSPGDVFTINANSGTSPKAFYFTDASYNVLTRGDKGSYTDYVIAAPETSSYLVINKNVSNTKNSYKGAIQNGLNITGVGSDNMIWSWETYPGIVSFNRVRNKVYWGYTSADGYRGVASYDFDTKETVKNNLFRGQIDDHNSTAVHVCSDGTIICGFSTGHNYDYCMHIRRSSVPECIERFDDDIIVAGIGETSYCQFASYGNRLYMFYRISNTTWLHRLSTDNGLTWSAPTQIVSSAEKMYIKIVPTTTETRMRILLFNNSTYDDSEIRQGFFDLTNGNIYNSDNSTLLGTSGLSITDFTVLIPLDSTLTHTRFFDSAITAPNNPLVAYCVFEQGDDSEYRIFDNGSVTATFVGGYGLLNYYQLGMAWRGTNQIVVAHGVNADGGTDLIDLYDYANGTSTFNTNLDSVIRGSVPVRLARPIVDQAGKAVIWQRGYYNRSDYTDFNMDAKLHMFVD